MSDKAKTWSHFLLGTLAGVIDSGDLIKVEGILLTENGPAIMAVDADGDEILISIAVTVREVFHTSERD